MVSDICKLAVCVSLIGVVIGLTNISRAINLQTKAIMNITEALILVAKKP